MREAGALGLDTPIGRRIEQVYLDAAARGIEGKDMTTVIQPMEQRAGVEVRRGR